jgi:hypothetical protein
MRNAQKAALMALFAAMEHDEDGEPTRREPGFGPVQDNPRPIQVDLLALASGAIVRGKAKTPA